MLIPIILSGGAGTRLWPLSRTEYPKPFVPFAGNSSLMQETIKRATTLKNISSILVVCSEMHIFHAQNAYKNVNPADITPYFIAEPCIKNTAPAILTATLKAQALLGDDHILLIMPSDHFIEDNHQFSLCVEKAHKLATKGHMVTFGIVPTSPHTGYGYILHEGEDVLSFIEKPAKAKAEHFVQSNNYLWNSGIFCASIKTILEAFARYEPKMLEQIRSIMTTSDIQHYLLYPFLLLDEDKFTHIKEVPFDIAIMEKISNTKVVKPSFDWSDLGDWQRFIEKNPLNTDTNVVSIDSDSTQVYPNADRTVALLGIENAIVVDTNDTTLILDRNQTHRVAEIRNSMQAINPEKLLRHNTVCRPWGTYTVLEEREGYKVKRIEVLPGQKLSLQKHKHRSEHWTVVQGKALVQIDEKEISLSVNESCYIPVGSLHRLINTTSNILLLIEIQLGNYLGEDDIERFDDHYGRS